MVNIEPKLIWKLRDQAPESLSTSLQTSSFKAQLLYNRGVTTLSEAKNFFSNTDQLQNPFLLPDMTEAVERLTLAHVNHEIVGVYGDFDTDGLTGTALIVIALREIGFSVIPYIPNRIDEGHGLNRNAMEEMKLQGMSLLITVDCGSTSIEEIAFAASIGIDTIVTDHHIINGPAPETIALVNPNQPNSEYPHELLTGSGLAFKLVQAFWDTLNKPFPNHFLGLAAMGTIADVGTLTGENRQLVKLGIEDLNQTNHPGLKALSAISGFGPGDIDTEALSFGLIPRLNAAGRIGDATMSLELLTTSDPDAAQHFASRLDILNEHRKKITKVAVQEALVKVSDENKEIPPLIMVKDPHWEPGILGLIANNLSDVFYRPVAALQSGDIVSRASLRSIPEFNVVDALHQCEHLLDKYGGHSMAAGFTTSSEKVEMIKTTLLEIADSSLSGIDLNPSILIDCAISPRYLVGDNYSFVQSLRPYGKGNPEPIFLTNNLAISSVRKVGRENNHLKMKISDGNLSWDAIAFRLGNRPIKAGDRMDIVYTANINTWGGTPKFELKILDFRYPDDQKV